jgi:DNA polymerase
MDKRTLHHQMESLLKDVSATLEFLHDSGCRGFDCAPDLGRMIQQWEKPHINSGESLNEIQKDLSDCQRCRLGRKRTQIVFGEGAGSARLVFVGEGPGFEEDRQGRPFVGAAGNLLNRIIEAMHLTRAEVYICNIVKCRPPSNRNPQSDEIAMCLPFLVRQLQAIKPDYICALGKVAAQTLLNTEDPISRLRGRFQIYQGIPIMPTYHPAYLLRNSDKKRDVWHDMQQIMKRMGLS